MKHIHRYEKFINENDNQELDDFDFLKSIGMIDPVQYALGAKQLGLLQPIIDQVMESDEYQKLMDIGMVLDSGVQQIKNGTLVFTKPGATKRLGIFPNGVIRRMFLRGDRGIDSKIKTFDSAGVEMYLEAMRWLLDNIDFNDTELLTTKSTQSKISAEQKKAEIMEDIYKEYAKLGMDRKETVKLIGHLPYNLTDAKEILATVKRHAKKGVVPFMGYISYNGPEDRKELFDILSKPGVTWIQMRNGGQLNVFSDSSRIWDNFDLDEHCRVMSTEGLYTFNKLIIKFADGDQLEQYTPIFNNYQPVKGVRLIPIVDKSIN